LNLLFKTVNRNAFAKYPMTVVLQPVESERNQRENTGIPNESGKLNVNSDIEARITKRKERVLGIIIVDMTTMMHMDIVLPAGIMHGNEVRGTKIMRGLRNITGIQRRMIGDAKRRARGLIMQLLMRGGNGRRRRPLQFFGRRGKGVQACTGRKEERRERRIATGCTTNGQRRCVHCRHCSTRG
jgi:hypothetical protein